MRQFYRADRPCESVSALLAQIPLKPGTAKRFGTEASGSLPESRESIVEESESLICRLAPKQQPLRFYEPLTPPITRCTAPPNPSTGDRE